MKRCIARAERAPAPEHLEVLAGRQRVRAEVLEQPRICGTCRPSAPARSARARAPPSAAIIPKNMSTASATGGGATSSTPRRPRRATCGRALDGRARLGRRRPGAVVRVEADAQAGDVDAAVVRRAGGPDEGIDPVATRDHAEHQREVADRARHRADGGHVEHAGLARRRPAAGLRHEPRARAQAGDAVVVARHADRAAAVRADAEQRAAAGDQRRLAAARAARGARGIERVERAPVRHRLGLVRPHVLGHRRLREDDGAGALDARDDRRVGLGDVALARRRAREARAARRRRASP